MNYQINLTIASPDFQGSLKKYTEDIKAAVDFFNLKSESMRNPKTLRLIAVEDSLCVVELASEKELPAPAKALRLFSQYLLEHSPISQYTYGSSLFRSVRVVNQLPPPPDSGEPTEIQVMDQLVRMLAGQFTGRNSYFATIKTLLDCSGDMDGRCLELYLEKVRADMIAEAEKWGH